LVYATATGGKVDDAVVAGDRIKNALFQSCWHWCNYRFGSGLVPLYGRRFCCIIPLARIFKLAFLFELQPSGKLEGFVC